MENLQFDYLVNDIRNDVSKLTVYFTNKIEFRLILYFAFFDLENFRLGSQKRHLTPLLYYYRF